MTQDEIDKVNERLAWLERKIVRILWLLVSVTSGLVSVVIAYTIDRSFGWPSVVVAIGIWITASFILQRHEFKDAPKHIQFIDP